MVTVPQDEAAMMSSHLNERRRDPDYESKPDHPWLNRSAEVAGYPQVGICCRNDPSVPMLVELGRQLRLSGRRKSHLTKGSRLYY